MIRTFPRFYDWTVRNRTAVRMYFPEPLGTGSLINDVFLEETIMTKENKFTGCTIVATGKLEHFTRDGINDKILELGAKPGSSVTKKTDYLICGEKAGSKLDLTSSVRIASMSHFIAPGKRTITYVVFDKANQVGTLERTVQYKDYTPPKIHLKAPLRYSTTEVGKANLTENMKAEDCLDGDLTSQIRTSLDDGMYNAAAGIYKVTVQVSNSAGDVCSVPLEVTVTESGDRQEQMKEYPVLSYYIAYTTVGHEIDPMSYVKGMEMNGATYTYADDGEALAGTREAISVKSEVDYSKAGVYPVEYSYTAEGSPTAVTKLFVVVQDQEGTQDGK